MLANLLSGIGKWLPRKSVPLGRHDIEWEKIGTCQERQEYLARAESEISAQRSVERHLVTANDRFGVAGTCYVCSRQVDFEVSFEHAYPVDGILTPNWRESLKCPSCGLNNRMRAVIHLLDQHLGGLSGEVYITEQTTDLYKTLAGRYSATLIGSEFLGPDRLCGEIDARGLRHENVTRLSFGDARFTKVLSFDVLEHVPDYRKALQEFLRCLAPRGHLIMSVPFRSDCADNLVRARMQETGEVLHLLPPEYHGDPVRDEGCLAFYHFGWRLLEEMRDLGFHQVEALYYWSREFGYLGREQMLIVARKPGRAFGF
jgi:SAM-dependent methyltransferase